MDRYETNRYINHLEDIVSSYNSQTNRTIRMSPNDAYLEVNYLKVMKNLEKHYNKAIQSKKKKKYNVGDRVRIFKLPKEGVFRKGYKPIFSEEVFKINRVDLRLPEPRYFLCDSENEEIIGSFQAHEPSVTRVN